MQWPAELGNMYTCGFKFLLVLRQLEHFFFSSHHDTAHMPTRKSIPSDDDDENNCEDESAPPPNKKAKLSSNKNDRGAHSATSASDTRLRTVSSKQAALSNFLFPHCDVLN